VSEAIDLHPFSASGGSSSRISTIGAYPRLKEPRDVDSVALSDHPTALIVSSPGGGKKNGLAPKLLPLQLSFSEDIDEK